MPIVVVGGHSRSVGKTSVVARLIAALPEFHWTALKITQYGHGICSANGAPCDCATDDHSFAVTEERDRSGESDTSRFLVAGAAQAWWVRTEQGRLAEAMPRVRQILSRSANAIIESNSILRFLKPDLYLTVLDPATADFKTSAQTFLDRADAVLLHETANSTKPAWERVSLKPVMSRPIFAIHAPQYVTAEIVEFVRTRLARSSSVTSKDRDPSLRSG
jgi:molybdopterin-guanine dinucleotide biosynthesis protein